MSSVSMNPGKVGKPKFNKYASRNERKNYWDKDDRDDAWERDNLALNKRAYELVKGILEKEKELRASKGDKVPKERPFVTKKFNDNAIYRLLLMTQDEVKGIHNSDFLGKYSYSCCDEMELRALIFLLPRSTITSDPKYRLREEVREVLRKKTKDHASKETVQKVKIPPFL